MRSAVCHALAAVCKQHTHTHAASHSTMPPFSRHGSVQATTATLGERTSMSSPTLSSVKPNGQSPFSVLYMCTCAFRLFTTSLRISCEPISAMGFASLHHVAGRRSPPRVRVVYCKVDESEAIAGRLHQRCVHQNTDHSSRSFVLRCRRELARTSWQVKHLLSLLKLQSSFCNVGVAS